MKWNKYIKQLISGLTVLCMVSCANETGVDIPRPGEEREVLLKVTARVQGMLPASDAPSTRGGGWDVSDTFNENVHSGTDEELFIAHLHMFLFEEDGSDGGVCTTNRMVIWNDRLFADSGKEVPDNHPFVSQADGMGANGDFFHEENGEITFLVKAKVKQGSTYKVCLMANMFISPDNIQRSFKSESNEKMKWYFNPYGGEMYSNAGNMVWKDHVNNKNKYFPIDFFMTPQGLKTYVEEMKLGLPMATEMGDDKKIPRLKVDFYDKSWRGSVDRPFELKDLKLIRAVSKVKVVLTAVNPDDPEGKLFDGAEGVKLTGFNQENIPRISSWSSALNKEHLPPLKVEKFESAPCYVLGWRGTKELLAHNGGMGYVEFKDLKDPFIQKNPNYGSFPFAFSETNKTIVLGDFYIGEAYLPAVNEKAKRMGRKMLTVDGGNLTEGQHPAMFTFTLQNRNGKELKSSLPLCKPVYDEKGKFKWLDYNIERNTYYHLVGRIRGIYPKKGSLSFVTFDWEKEPEVNKSFL